MAYATQADLSPAYLAPKVLVELTDDERTGQVVAAVVTAKLNDASGIIETYCRERYALPLQQTPELTAICCKLACYALYARRQGKVPEVVTEQKEEAMRMLRDISGKKASLDQPTGVTDQGAANTIQVSRRERPFDRRKIEGFL